jgi:hypothetical protein
VFKGVEAHFQFCSTYFLTNERTNINYIGKEKVSRLSNGHSPQIRQNRELLVRMCRGESHFSQKWPLANVGESGEYSVNGLANGGESGESCKYVST